MAQLAAGEELDRVLTAAERVGAALVDAESRVRFIRLGEVVFVGAALVVMTTSALRAGVGGLYLMLTSMFALIVIAAVELHLADVRRRRDAEQKSLKDLLSVARTAGKAEGLSQTDHDTGEVRISRLAAHA